MSTEIKPRRYQFRDEIVAQARYLLLEGRSTYRVAAMLQEMFSGENTPAQQTVSLWCQDLVEAGCEELRVAEPRIANRFDQLVEAKLESLEDHLDKVRLPELVMGAGVYRDKIFKRSEKPSISAQQVTINFIVESKPIEAEYEE